jgi:hypothetical protein
MRRTLSIPIVGFLWLLVGAAAGMAQDSTESRDEIRLGVTLGGTGFLGLVAEYRRGDWAGELTVGSITFREVAVAVAGKRYFTEGRLQPFVGAGLWSLTAWTEDGSGSVLIARAPLGVDWLVTGGHSMGLEVGLNRALAVNRLDPDDDTPPSTNVVPLPGIYYRYGWDP